MDADSKRFLATRSRSEILMGIDGDDDFQEDLSCPLWPTTSISGEASPAVFNPGDSTINHLRSVSVLRDVLLTAKMEAESSERVESRRSWSTRSITRYGMENEPYLTGLDLVSPVEQIWIKRGSVKDRFLRNKPCMRFFQALIYHRETLFVCLVFSPLYFVKTKLSRWRSRTNV